MKRKLIFTLFVAGLGTAHVEAAPKSSSQPMGSSQAVPGNSSSGSLGLLEGIPLGPGTCPNARFFAFVWENFIQMYNASCPSNWRDASTSQQVRNSCETRCASMDALLRFLRRHNCNYQSNYSLPSSCGGAGPL